VVTMLLGMGGALVGGVIGRLFRLYAPGQRAGFLMSTLGAILLLAVYRSITHRRTSVEPLSAERSRRRAA
jgi:uncharacterized membrane protein YeaQ/YmgE (transglycosylase-associated protein family)